MTCASEVRKYYPSLGVAAGAALILLLGCWAAPADSSAGFTRSWAVEIVGGIEAADALAEKYGFTNIGQVGNLQDMYHFTHNSHGSLVETGGGLELDRRSIQPFQSHGDHLRTLALQREINVGYVKQQELLEIAKKDYVPPEDPQWPDQWSLQNVGQTSGKAGLDLNVEPVWIQGISGHGVVVTVVDDGVEAAHPDLHINFDRRASRDFVEHDSDPSPSGDDYHGTACAGIIGMARNGVCGVGVAPGTRLGGLRFDFGYTFDLAQAGILSYARNYVDVYSNSWGPMETGFTVGGPGYLILEALRRETQEGRNNKGSIYVWASGNGGRYFDSCAADGYVNSIYTIAVGSADQEGRPADYDEACSAKMAVTFSHNSNPPKEDSKQLYTTSLHGQCSESFSGTSASAPLLAGVIALALEANPELTWRDVQYLIAYTSNPDILTVDDLATNGAGLKFSHHFGFGAIDAEAMVTRARHWINVPEQISQSFTHSTIHDVPASGSTVINFNVDNSRLTYETIQSLEHVVLRITLEIGDKGRSFAVEDFIRYQMSVGNDTELLTNWLTLLHPRRGDIQLQLTSPSNTTTTLLPYRDFDFVNSEGYDDWPFMTVHNWGEKPHGVWSLRVSYKSSSGFVRVSGVNLTLYGTWQTPESVRTIPDQCHSSCARGCWEKSSASCDVCDNLRLDSTLECVDKCPSGFTEYKSYCILEQSLSSDEVTTESSTAPSDEATTESSTAQGETETESDNRLNMSILISSIAGVLILVSLIIVGIFIVLIAHQHYCRSKQASFLRLQENITSV